MTNSEPPEILVVDHTNINLDLINDTFTRQQISASFDLTQSVPELLTKLEEKTWQAIFLVIDNIPISVDALVEAMPAINKKCPVIVICHEYDRETALLHIRSGATDVFSLDEIEHLVNLTRQLISNNRLNNTIKNQRHALKESYERFIALSKQIPMAIAFIHDGAFININPAFQNFFNIGATDEISEISFLDLVADDDIDKVKLTLQQFNKKNAPKNIVVESVKIKKSVDDICSVNLHIAQTIINGETSLQVIFQPTEWDIKPSTLIVNHNQLLGAEIFIQSLNQVIRKANKNHAYCLCFFELDGYSRIKNNIGITRSDHLLHEISDFMTSHASAEIKISRLNSDVYTLLVTADTPSDCIKKIEALQTEFAKHSFNSIDHSIKVSSNIGIVHLTEFVHTPDQALSLADVACTVSRNRQLNQPHIYNPEEDRSTVELVDQNWADKIQDALKYNNFKLLFQPIVSLGSNKEILYEVLIRIKGSGNEDTLPGQFLHAARQSKLESDIDKWVIRHAVQMLQKAKKTGTRFFINLSESSLKDINFIEWLEKHYGTELDNLVFEIPEHTALMWQSETLHFIQEIKTLKGEVCIDQFGNHPENKSQIDAFHADFHKIDGAFVSNLSTNRKHQSIIHNISLSSQDSSTKIIASYVQDADSLAILWREGIDFIQGHYLQPPAAHLDYKFEAQI